MTSKGVVEKVDGNDVGEQYKVTISGGGISIDRYVDKQSSLKIIAILMGADSSGLAQSALQNNNFRTSDAELEKLSAQEYVETTMAVQKVHVIVAVCGYLTQCLKQKYFSADDIKDQMEEAGFGRYPNFIRDIRLVIKSGWVARRQGVSSEYWLTIKGTKAIETKFDGERTKYDKKGKRAKR